MGNYSIQANGPETSVGFLVSLDLIRKEIVVWPNQSRIDGEAYWSRITARWGLVVMGGYESKKKLKALTGAVRNIKFDECGQSTCLPNSLHKLMVCKFSGVQLTSPNAGLTWIWLELSIIHFVVSRYFWKEQIH